MRATAPLFALALLVELAVAIVGSGLKAIDTDGPDGSHGSPSAIGELFLTKFLLPFELVSFLLLIAAVGAIVLARRDPEATELHITPGAGSSPCFPVSRSTTTASLHEPDAAYGRSAWF